MPVPASTLAHGPRRNSAFIPLVSRLLLLLLLPATIYARPPQPAVTILLDPLGYMPLTQRYLLAGSSMLTLHYVDDTHLLLTFNSRRLIHRVPNDPPTDQDRDVDALLLELPSGRILARHEWHFHDHGQYLWAIGHGQFIIRIRNSFSLIAPLCQPQTRRRLRRASLPPLRPSG